MFVEWPQVWTIVSAELVFLLVRSSDIQTLVKHHTQRSRKEQHRIKRGLARSIGLEFLVFVPASAALLLLVTPVALHEILVDQSGPRLWAIYAALGMASYGFPFATIRRIVTIIALQTLKEFMVLVPHDVADSDDDTSGESS